MYISPEERAKRKRFADRQNDIAIISGLGGQGKSALAKALVFQEYNKMPCIIIDRQMQYYDGIIFNDTVKTWNYICDNEERIFKYNEKLILQTDKGDEETLFKLLYEKLQNPKRRFPRDLCLVLDEADDYYNINTKDSILDKILKFSRNRGFWILATFKNFQDVNKNIEKLAKRIICFQNPNGLCLKKIQNNFNEKMANIVLNLDDYEFLLLYARAKENQFVYEKAKLPEYYFNFI